MIPPPFLVGIIAGGPGPWMEVSFDKVNQPQELPRGCARSGRKKHDKNPKSTWWAIRIHILSFLAVSADGCPQVSRRSRSHVKFTVYLYQGLQSPDSVDLLYPENSSLLRRLLNDSWDDAQKNTNSSSLRCRLPIKYTLK